MYRGILSVVILLYTFFKNRGTRREISKEAFLFTAFWVAFINGFIYFFNKINFRYGKLSKEETTKEYGLINREINSSILVDSCGLNMRYENAQQDLMKRSESKKSFYRSMSRLGKIIPWHLLVNFFPFLLLVFDKDFIGINLFII